MSAIEPVVAQRLQLGITEVLAERFHCTRQEHHGQFQFQRGPQWVKTIQHRCEWPNGSGPVGFGRLHYHFSVQIRDLPKGKVDFVRRAYLVWEGILNRWDNWRWVKAYDVDLDGRLDEVFLRPGHDDRTEYQRQNGHWHRVHLTQKTDVSPFELQEILEPAQESYTHALILGGLMVNNNGQRSGSLY